jgi:hypothetical protein
MVFGNSVTSGSTGTFVSIDTQRRWREDTPWGPCDGTGAFDTDDGTTYYSGTVGTYTGSGDNYIVNPSGSPWVANVWQPSPVGDPYSFHDVTQNFGFEIASSTPSSITSFFSCNGNGCGSTPANGDSFQIVRASVCMDQPGRGKGLLLQGGDCNSYPTSGSLCPVLVSTGKAGSVAEALDPSYEFDDSGTTGSQYVSNDSEAEIANRDWYSQNVGQTAQTSSTSPFNGSSGTGWGTLANRPANCTAGVGYWATDQGSWNQSGNSFGQGELFICGASGWPSSPSYVPYAYPHPLDSSTGSSAPTPTPGAPTSLTATPTTPWCSSGGPAIEFTGSLRTNNNKGVTRPWELKDRVAIDLCQRTASLWSELKLIA